MSASQELKLIAKIADVGNLRPVIDAGITADKLKDRDARLIYDYFYRYWHGKSTRNNVPTRDLIAEQFPSVDLPRSDRMDLNSTINEFIEHDRKVALNTLIDYMATWSDDPSRALHKAEKVVRELLHDRRTSVDVNVSRTVEAARIRYEARKNKTTMTGVPWPWEILNRETQGMQDGEFDIFYARPKSLKTWLGLYVCTHAYDVSNQRVLIYTREMSPEQMMDRCICLLIGAPYDAFKRGYLHDVPHPFGGTMEEAFYGLLNTMKRSEKTCALETGKNKSLIITSDRQDRKTGGGVNGLRRKIEDHAPDLTFVDAVYLMRNDRGGGPGERSMKWTDQAAVSQDLKDLAQDTNRPILATLQANRGSEQNGGKSASNMAYSDSYAQDCDLAIEVIKQRIDREHNVLALALTASREVNIAGFAINGNPGNDFSQLMRPVKDGHGTELGLMEPVIFEDFEDIQKMFETSKDKKGKKASMTDGVDFSRLLKVRKPAEAEEKKGKRKRAA